MGAMVHRWAGIWVLAAVPAGADPIAVPSGQGVTLHEVITDARGVDGLTMRFHFIAPALGSEDGFDPDATLLDMEHLCRSYALPRLRSGTGPAPAHVVVGLADRPVPLGEVDPEAVQLFEAFRIEGEDCVADIF